MTEERHHATLRDYGYALRRRKFVIIGIALVAALAAAGLTFTQKKTYTAESSLQALNPAQTAALAGVLESNQELATETSAQLAQTVTRSNVITAVKQQLHLSGTVSDITSNITTSIDPQSNFVLVDATAHTPAGAANLATALAKTVADITNSQVQDQYARQAKQTQKAAQGLLLPFRGIKASQLTGATLQAFENVQAQASTEQQNAGKLETLSQVAQVTQVEALPSIPTSPSGPHPGTNIVLGVVVGLLLGLLVTWFLESLDRRLRRPDETESLLGMPVVGVVPQGQLGKPPTADDKEGNTIAAFRMLRTNVRFLAPDRGVPPRAVLVTSSVSEEGKTTVAMGLALSSAAAGLNTLLIEADTHRPAHAKRLGIAPAPGIADFLNDNLTPDKVLQVYPFAEQAAGASGQTNGHSNGQVQKLTCITAGNASAFSGDALGSQRFADVVNEVKQVYDLVVIDSAPLLAVAETSELVSFVDAIVFCVRLGTTTAEQVRAARAALARLPHRMGGLVLTDVRRNVGGFYGYGYDYSYAEKTQYKEAAAG
ncbi:MAG TPA: Wzz/FepE/Etk N-terminal domain-containing protein [Solirubrobacteraceae bacterium]|nr:Wzz/FepE/Etk N-terminal domain-containing protein [Solirubrobacteraceae bacterium]